MLLAGNKLEDDKGVRSVDQDILFCSRFYAEPKFRYDEQEEYWKSRQRTIKAMANNSRFSKMDI